MLSAVLAYGEILCGLLGFVKRITKVAHFTSGIRFEWLLLCEI